MNWAADCCVVIPCLNEAREIGRVVSAARRFLPEVLAVDDGSTDGTAEIARAAGARVLSHASALGKGQALRTGFAAAVEHGFSRALAMDGDGQHSPEDIPRFLADGERGARMVIGNRMTDARAMPWLRRQVNGWMSRALGEFCGQPAPDTQCGFRLVHLPSWGSLHFSARHFEAESELFVRFAAAGYSIAWVPVQTRYGGERSKIHPFRDTVRWFRWWMGIRRELGAIERRSPRASLLHDPA